MDARRLALFEEVPPGAWLGELTFDVDRRGEKSRLTHIAHLGPLRIQRPFYPEGDGTAHVYVLHPPGGVAGGDHLRISAHVHEGAAALLTMPAATKVYRTLGPTSVIENHLTVQAGASLEWLPQEAILFDGSISEQRTVVRLEAGAEYLGWEIACLGRPAAGEDFRRGRFRQALEIYREGSPIFVDQLVVPAESVMRVAAWGLAGAGVLGSFLLASSEPRLLSVSREALVRASDLWERRRTELSPPSWETERGRFAVTHLSGALCVRYLGYSVAECQQGFSEIWKATRPLVLGKSAVVPRIWRV